MALPVPNLDDKVFSELVEEARALIPRFAPEWTDHNLHDPGVTMIELFAWLTEMQLYRLNRVSNESRKRFLALVGVEPRSVRPSRVRLSFDYSGGKKSLPVPQGAKITPKGKEELVFETGRDFCLTLSRIQLLQTRRNDEIIDHVQANDAPGVFFAPFGEDGSQNAFFEIGFDRSLDPDHFTDLYFQLYETDLPPVGEHGDEPADHDFSVELAWEYLSDAQTWRELTVLDDASLTLTRSGFIRFQNPRAMWRRDDDLFLIRARIVARDPNGKYDLPPRVEKIHLNMIEARQVETTTFEVLGTASDRPGQKFGLRNSPVVLVKAANKDLDDANSLVIETGNETDGWEDWACVEDFEKSGPGDAHFVMNPENGEIQFGNGLNGHIPLSGMKIRVRQYQASQGAAGNLPAGHEWTTAFVNVVGANLEAAEGGEDFEKLEAAEKRARKSFNKRSRAITMKDFEDLALNAPGLRVARAAAIPNYHPAAPGTVSPASITVVAAPFTRTLSREQFDSAPPAPSESFLRRVRRHLAKHRVVTTDLHVVPPEYVQISVKCRVFPMPKTGTEQVRDRIKNRLNEFLHPTQGGPESKGWPFGRQVFLSEIYQVIDKVEGVDYVTELQILRGDQLTSGDAVEIPAIGLVYAGTHEIEVL